MAVTKISAAQGGSARMRLYRWVESKVAGLGAPDRIKLSDLVEQAEQDFATNPAWVRQFVEETLGEMIRSVAQQAVGSTRGSYKKFIFKGEIMGVAAYANQTSAEAAALQMRLMSKWGGWMEHVGDEHRRLLTMTRLDLIKAAEERERRANRELEVAALWRALAARMADDTTTVKEAFNLAEIEQISVAIRTERGTFDDPTITPSDDTATPSAEEETPPVAE